MVLEGIIRKLRKSAAAGAAMLFLGSSLHAQQPSINMGFKLNNNLISTNSSEKKAKPEINLEISDFSRFYNDFGINPLYNILRIDEVGLTYFSGNEQKAARSESSIMLGASVPLLQAYLDPNTFSATRISVFLKNLENSGTNSSTGEKIQRVAAKQVLDPFYILESRLFPGFLSGFTRPLFGVTELDIENSRFSKNNFNKTYSERIENLPPLTVYSTKGDNLRSINSEQFSWSAKQEFLPSLFNLLQGAYFSLGSFSAHENSRLNESKREEWGVLGMPQWGETDAEAVFKNKTSKNDLRLSFSTISSAPSYLSLSGEYAKEIVKNNLREEVLIERVGMGGSLQDINKIITEDQNYSFTELNALLNAEGFIRQLGFFSLKGNITKGDGEIADDDTGLLINNFATKAEAESGYRAYNADVCLFNRIYLSVIRSSKEDVYNKRITGGAGGSSHINLNDLPQGMLDNYCTVDGVVSSSTNKSRKIDLFAALIPSRAEGKRIAGSRVIQAKNDASSLIGNSIKSSYVRDILPAGLHKEGVFGIGVSFEKYNEHQQEIYNITRSEGTIWSYLLRYSPFGNTVVDYSVENDVGKWLTHKIDMDYCLMNFHNSAINNVLFNLTFSKKEQLSRINDQLNADEYNLGFNMSFGFFGKPRNISEKRIEREESTLDEDTIKEAGRLFSRLAKMEKGNMFLYSGNQNESRLHIQNALEQCKRINAELVGYGSAIKHNEIDDIEADDAKEALAVVKKNTERLNESHFNKMGKHLVVDSYIEQDAGALMFIELGDVVKSLDGKKFDIENGIVLANHDIENNLGLEAYSDGKNAVYNLKKFDEYVNGLSQMTAGLPKWYIKQVAADKSYNSELTDSEMDAIKAMLALILRNNSELTAYDCINSRSKHEEVHNRGNPCEKAAVTGELKNGNKKFALLSVLGYKDNLIREYAETFDYVYISLSHYGLTHGEQYGINPLQNIVGQIPKLYAEDAEKANQFIENAFRTKRGPEPERQPKELEAEIKPDSQEDAARGAHFIDEKSFYEKNRLIFEDFEQLTLVDKFAVNNGKFEVMLEDKNVYGKWDIEGGGDYALNSVIRLPDLTKFKGMSLRVKSEGIASLDLVIEEIHEQGNIHWKVPINRITDSWKYVDVPFLYFKREDLPGEKLNLNNINSIGIFVPEGSKGSVSIDDVSFYRQ